MNVRTILYLEWLRVNHDDLNFRLRCFQCHRCYNYTLVLLFEVLHYNVHILKLNGMRMHVSHGTVKLRFTYITLVSAICACLEFQCMYHSGVNILQKKMLQSVPNFF